MGQTILLIHTGGTLGMAPTKTSSSLAPGPSLDLIFEQVPELERLGSYCLRVPFNRDSATLEPVDILCLASILRAEAAKVDGIVVIHGTDTMAFTASVLGFLLADLNRPVVITGSQRPLAFARSDARSNLVDAVTLSLSGVPEVGICFGDHWLRGVATDKVSVHRYEAFESPNLPPLAELGLHLQMHPHAGIFKRAVPPGVWSLNTEIEIHTPHPGMPWYPPRPETKGIVIQAFGAGNLPMEREDLAAMLAECRHREIPVVITSQCLSGSTDLSLYDLGRRALEEGCISGGPHTRWAAVAKLALCLGAGADVKGVREAFATSWAGEPV